MSIVIVVGCSVLLQVLTAIQAIRLIRVTGRHMAWALIASYLPLVCVKPGIFPLRFFLARGFPGGTPGEGGLLEVWQA